MSRSFYLAFVLGIGAAAVSAVLAQSVPGAGKTAPATVPVAAEPPADPAPQVIRVEAIVTDRQGKPILNLRPEEFSLLDNGVAQPLVSAALTTVRSVVGPAIEPPVFATPEDEERAAKEEGTRVIGLYLDEYHVSAGESTDRVRHAAARFVDEHVRPGDVLVVLKPLDSLTDIRFSRSRDAARQKIAGFSGRKDDYTPRAPFEEQYMGRSAASVRSARAQIVISVCGRSRREWASSMRGSRRLRSSPRGFPLKARAAASGVYPICKASYGPPAVRTRCCTPSIRRRLRLSIRNGPPRPPRPRQIPPVRRARWIRC